MKRCLSVLLICAVMFAALSGCTGPAGDDPRNDDPIAGGSAADLGDDDSSFGDSFEDLNIYDGYFQETETDVVVTCVSGTQGCYTLEENTLTFTAVSEDSVYAVSGQLQGNIVIDVGDEHKFDLELQGFSLVSDSGNPVLITSGDEVSITAKAGFENYIYDTRPAVDETDETLFSGAIHATVDLKICGKGSLTVVSENNNGIHTKDDLQVKNLTLTVICMDNALKGNDSVQIKNATTTLIATQGDGIKTKNSDISQKGNQRGTVTIQGGTHEIYAACDGIDAAYNVVIEEDTTSLNIYTDKYSNYSSQITATDEEQYYIRFTSDQYQYAIKYYNADDDYYWVNAQYHSCVSGGRNSYYYYSFPEMEQYSKMQLFIYSSDMTPGQETDYLVASDYLTLNTEYDTFALSSQGNSLTYSWTNYTTSVQDNGWGGMGGHGGMGGGPGGMGGMGGGPGGMGGMNEGNSEKGEYSTKGIKADNEIFIYAGTINIKSYDDAIHANSDSTLENGESPTGNITVSGGTVTAYSNDDALHADGTLCVTSGTICVTHSYEGLEGTYVSISGGNVSIISSDDGINATTTSGTGVTISGGRVYIYCGGDGIDSNSRTSYSGIVFSGGKTVVISTSGGDSAIDTENGYAYTGGSVLAVMPRGGMTSEATHCNDFKSIATSASVSLSTGNYLTVKENGTVTVAVQMPVSLSAMVIYLGNNNASISSETSLSETADDSGVWWNS